MRNTVRMTAGAKARQLRLERMQALIGNSGPALLSRVAELLGVTEMTIRRDLAVAGSPLSCLGGYVLEATLPASSEQYVLAEEIDHHTVRKRLACQRAAAMVEEGDSLFIDCGTTMLHFAAALPPDIALTVVCYSMNVADIIGKRANTQLILLGGLYQPSSLTFYSEESVQYLGRLGVNKAFISAGGADPVRGVSCSHFHEVATKQAAIRSAAQSILVVDESKLGRVRTAFFSPLDVFSKIVVGGEPDSELAAQFQGWPLEVVAAPAAVSEQRFGNM
ncbi:DeoR/GlpR family DNA-binding transcription regulator [Janthinobacterium aquaticum]|uniref:DeoR/GlpR family DNA-binding transcription regulator n=1 Tax=Janthinobacterium sp. FT58W TaxID=2654254 RepID=UPI00126496B7|nr:DeoR/GlpR family DNA-binding transcription regulator [Janthinobacterium sp. FT58W]KAB8045265.1 DeoR family transcriptional regulator [Janthinobacterium sp. FT58W]